MTPGRISGWVVAAAVAALAAGAVGCGSGSPETSGPSGSAALDASPPADRLHAQAQAALERWAAAGGGGAGPEVGIVGELTGQVGDWEIAVGDNNKPALMAGLVRVAADLPADVPPDGEVAWPDGTTKPAPLLSAVQAAALLGEPGAAGSCDGCRPLDITSARLGRGPIETSRGPATAPIWQFTLAATRVIVTRVALAEPVAAQPPPWDPNDPPVGISIDGAVGLPGDSVITVSFVGAPGTAAEPCGADYTGEPVESDLAIVVIVIEHRNPLPAACTAVGAVRTATVQLGRPLGDRAVLEVKEGLPVRVMTP